MSYPNGEQSKTKIHTDKEENITINTTKIKYIKVEDKIYMVSDISFSDMHIQAVEIDLSIKDIPANELFNISELKEFRIILKNMKGQAKIICFDEWKIKQI